MQKIKTKINFNKLKNKNKLKKKLSKIPKKSKNVKINKNKKKHNFRFGYSLLVIITSLAIALMLGFIGLGTYIIIKAPEFTPNKLYKAEKSVIYFANDEVMATLGINTKKGQVEQTEKRDKVKYDELSQVLIDAIVATEDSRFFQHKGFDLFRFLKATAGQLVGHSSAGGASTLTMQIVKNNFTNTVSHGIRGIIRKFTDIYIAVFKIERNYNKEDILEFYVNGPYLGGDSYGVEEASLTYFNKDVSDLSLPEAALIAGLFQAPSSYDPFAHPKEANARKNVVLNLMLRHGYITKNECEIAKSMDISKLLTHKKIFNISPYQGVIDTVTEELIDKYDINPHKTSVEVYTTIRKDKQDIINKFYNQDLGYKFRDDKIQVGISMLDNNNGSMIAVGAGRNKETRLSFNYATMVSAHPGSTAKPIFEYGPGIEYMKWSTYTPCFDERGVSYSDGTVINNWDFNYNGLISLRSALSLSKNTCALQAFQKLDNKLILKFATSLGIKPEVSNGYVHEAHALGAFNGVNPTELAGAYSAFANGGYFTKPYIINKIVFKDSGKVIEPKHKKEKVMSPQTAYIITTILYKVTPYSVKVRGTDISTKTGTSTYDKKALKAVGAPSSTIRDSWVATYSPDYTLAFWYGYPDLKAGYSSMASARDNRNQIQGVLLNNLFETNKRFKNPGNISKVEVELETFPAQKPSEFTPSNLRQTHLFIAGTEPSEISQRFAKLPSPTNLVVDDGYTIDVSWNKVPTPLAIDNDYLKEYFKNNYGKFADKYLNRRINYNNEKFGEFGYDVYLKKGMETKYLGFTTDNKYEISSSEGYDEVMVKTAYKNFKENSSNPIYKHISAGYTDVRIELLALDGERKIHPEIPVGGEIPDIGIDTIKIIIDDIDETSSIDKSNISINIINGLTKEVVDSVDDIDTSKKGFYQVVYTFYYLGNTYSSNPRNIIIE